MHRPDPRPFARLLPVAAAAAFAALLATGCGDLGDADGVASDVAKLRERARSAEAERDRLASRLDLVERRIAGLQADLAQTRSDAQEAAAAAAEARSGAPAAETGTPPAAPLAQGDPRIAQSAKELSELLASDEGRAVFDQALAAYEARREQDRGSRMATDLVTAFAQKANLSVQQKDSMMKIVSTAMSDMGVLFRTLRDDTATPEERSAKRQEAIVKMQEISQRTDDEVKGILDAAQWDTYQQERGRMRGFLGGAGGGMGGGGAGGRFGGNR